MRRSLAIVTLVLLAILGPSAASRLLTLDDIYRLRDVGDPQLSPDGGWVVYTVETHDAESDSSDTHLWMTRYDGGRTVQLTTRTKESETQPRFGPDGRYLAFLSARTDDAVPVARK